MRIINKGKLSRLTDGLPLSLGVKLRHGPSHVTSRSQGCPLISFEMEIDSDGNVSLLSL